MERSDCASALDIKSAVSEFNERVDAFLNPHLKPAKHASDHSEGMFSPVQAEAVSSHRAWRI